MPASAASPSAIKCFTKPLLVDGLHLLEHLDRFRLARPRVRDLAACEQVEYDRVYRRGRGNGELHRTSVSTSASLAVSFGEHARYGAPAHEARLHLSGNEERKAVGRMMSELSSLREESSEKRMLIFTKTWRRSSDEISPSAASEAEE